MDNLNLDLETVKGFLEANRETEGVSGLIADMAETFLGSDAGKKVLQPKLDKHFSKGIETWKANNLQGLIDDEISRKFPPESEEQKQLRALQKQLDAIEKEKSMATIKAEAIQEMTKQGLPVSVADIFVTDNLETTRDRIHTFAQEFSRSVRAEVDARLKTSGGTPRNQSQGTESGDMTREQLLAMSYHDRSEFYRENPDEFQRLMKG
jgi:hypothetical protein